MSTDDRLALCLGPRIIFISFWSILRMSLMWQASPRAPAYQELGLRALVTQNRQDAPRRRHPGPNALLGDALSSTATHEAPYRRRRVIGFPLCWPNAELENSAEPNPADPAAPGASVSTRLQLIQIIIAVHPPTLPKSDGMDGTASRSQTI